VLTNKQTDKQTPLKTSNALRYATTLGDKVISKLFQPSSTSDWDNFISARGN